MWTFPWTEEKYWDLWEIVDVANLPYAGYLPDMKKTTEGT
jgi:hypothetical protein